MSTATVLRGAADVIRRNGWHQDSYYDSGYPDLPKNECPVCARGAINIAANGLPDLTSDVTDAADDAMHQYLGIDGQFPHSLADWNDAPERTADEVIAALEAAADRLDEQPPDGP